MSLVVYCLWIETKSWDITGNTLNVLYKNSKIFIFIDSKVITEEGQKELLHTNLNIKKAYIYYPNIYFITRNVDTPFVSLNLENDSLSILSINGTFSDFEIKSQILLSSSSFLNSKSYNLKDSSYIEMYGTRVLNFYGHTIVLDLKGNLMDINTSSLIDKDVKNVNSSYGYLLIFKEQKLVIMDNNFNTLKEYPGNFIDGFAIDIEGDGNYEFLTYDKNRLYLIKDNDIEILSILKETIKCVLPIDYNKDGSYDLLVLTNRALKLYEQPIKTKLELDFNENLSLSNSCGSVWGLELVPKAVSKSDPFSIKVKYTNSGFILSLNNKYGERVRISLLDARGTFIKEIYNGSFYGPFSINVDGLDKSGIYIVNVIGEASIQKFPIIWNKK